ncbi:helix-turn-helix domain-containing protein [Alistipes onderdonkii]|uniref:helix-turn-helix domain-containing protein n=1 Tax=Alistipes onderdonkii TaxID=328813 RepID=UPI0036F30014
MWTTDGSLKLQQLTTQTVAYVTARLRALRCERGLTVPQVAGSCGMECSNLSRLEAGRANPTLRTLCAQCLILGVGIRELFPPADRELSETTSNAAAPDSGSDE